MYQESEEAHRTSMSGVSIPRWSICLKPRVRGNGSLTRIRRMVNNVEPHINPSTDLGSRGGPRTKDESGEEEIDPAHDEHLRDHGNKLVLHARHHSLHHSWVSEGVHRGWCDPIPVFVTLDGLRGVNFEVVTLRKGMCEVVCQCCKVRGWDWG